MNYSYSEVIHTIQNTRRFGNLTGYEVSKRMLEQLGNPQCGIPFVHVAGTNGKGSTTAFLCKILEQTGKKIGMFTSPHLVEFEERIRINGAYIPKEDVTRIGNLLLSMGFDVSPTMFDYCLAMAVLYFKEQQCDMIVMETGIGGRYDSTNALGIPEVSVITKIGFDHTAVLGNTLAEIAGEKAGIIKQGAHFVFQRQEAEARDVLLENYRFTGQDMSMLYEITEEDVHFAETLPKRMVGKFQSENAATAIETARIILEKWAASDSEIAENIERFIEKGIAETFWKGRMEIVNENPFFMVDGAHNSHGVHALAEGLRSLYPNEKFHFIMGVMADKDYEEMIDELLPLAIDFVTVTPESNRALQSKDLAECITRKGVEASYAQDMEEVIRPLLQTQLTGSFDKTVAFGSLYFIGEIEAMLEKNIK